MLALQERHAKPHQIIEGIPMHHVPAAIHNVNFKFRVRVLEQFGALARMGTVFTAEDH